MSAVIQAKEWISSADFVAGCNEDLVYDGCDGYTYGYVAGAGLDETGACDRRRIRRSG
jgi:hypothetical protein